MGFKTKQEESDYNRAYYKKRKEQDPQYARRESIRNRHGLTLEEYDSRLLEQGRACYVCSRTTKHMHLDHNHETGALRKFLCMSCNRALGYAGDSAERLRALANYLEEHA